MSNNGHVYENWPLININRPVLTNFNFLSVFCHDEMNLIPKLWTMNPITFFNTRFVISITGRSSIYWPKHDKGLSIQMDESKTECKDSMFQCELIN